MPQLNYRKAVAALADESQTIRSPVTGIIETAMVHFPLGCNALVGIKMIKGKEQLLPTNVAELALDDTTDKYYIGKPVKENDEIICQFFSHDSTYSHTISIILWISEVREGVKQPEIIQPTRGVING